jgi:hypothetical protein
LIASKLKTSFCVGNTDVAIKQDGMTVRVFASVYQCPEGVIGLTRSEMRQYLQYVAAQRRVSA